MRPVDKIKGLRIYLIVNAEGEFYGRPGVVYASGKWSSEVEDARIYHDFAAVKGLITTMRQRTVGFNPEILEITPGKVRILTTEHHNLEAAQAKLAKAELDLEAAQHAVSVARKVVRQRK